MQKEINKFCDTDVMEGMSSISAVIKSMDNHNYQRKIISVYIDKSKIKSKEREISFLKRKSQMFGFSIEFTSAEAIDEMSTGSSHGGIIAFCSPREIQPLEEKCIKPQGVYYRLDGVEDPYNFGYAVRSIYAAGGDGIILTPRNWMGVAGVVARSSAGTSELIDMYVSTPEDAIRLFKKCEYKIVSAGIRNSESLFDTDLKKPLFVILGGEKRGISSKVLEMSDKIVRIDYGREFNGSLSTAAATAVFAFEILRSNK